MERRVSAFEVKKLAAFLRDLKVKNVFVVGLSYDYCVAYTALDSSLFNFKTYIIHIIQDCCNPRELNSGNDMSKELNDSDIRFCKYEDIISEEKL